MQSVTTLNLNLQYPNYAVTMHAVQNDKLTRKVTANLFDGSVPFTPAEGALALIRYHKPDGTTGFYDTDENGDAAVTWNDNVATVSLAEQALTCAGNVLCQIQFYTQEGERLTTFTWRIDVEECAMSDEYFMSTDYYSVLSAQISAALSITYRPPYINTDTGNWMTWSVQTNQYEDSGYSAQGSPGEPGATGAYVSSITRISGTGAPGTTDTWQMNLSNGGIAGTFTVYNGADGAYVSSITKVSGTGAGGTVDVYNVNLSNGQVAGQISVYNGADGQGAPGSATPLMDGTADAGTATAYAREDHVHPKDTSKAPIYHAVSSTGFGVGTGQYYGHVKLSDATNLDTGNTGGIAATPKAVKAAYDNSELKAPIDHATDDTTYGAGSGSNYGHVKLSDATNSTSSTSGGIAATPAAVKAAYDLANGRQQKNVYFTNVAASGFVSDATYSDFPYRCAVSLTGVTASMFVEVVFSLSDAMSGNYAPICEAYAGGVYIYAKTNTAITIPTIAVSK